MPDPAAAAVLVQGAAFDQRPEMLLEGIAAGAGQLDGLAKNTPIYTHSGSNQPHKLKRHRKGGV